MSVRPSLKAALKRGALVSAANWPVVLTQFVAESLFKLLLTVPLAGGALLVVAAAGGSASDFLAGDLRDSLSAITTALVAHPITLAAFLAALLITVVGGSSLMFFVKGGTVAILARGDLCAGPVERYPVTLASLRRGAAFSVEAMLDGCGGHFARFLRLGLGLLAVYGVSAAIYLAALLGGYNQAVGPVRMVGWTLVTAIMSATLAIWITIVNLLYLLSQIVIVVDDVPVLQAVRRVAGFVRREPRELAGIFLIVLGLLVLALMASVLTTAALGLIGFVPWFWMTALPLQLAAWLVRGVVFQYLGLTALAAYLTVYRSATVAETAPANGHAAPSHLGQRA